MKDNLAHQYINFSEKIYTMPTCVKSTPSWSALYCSVLCHANLANERLQILEGCIQRLLQKTQLTVNDSFTLLSSGVAQIKHIHNNYKTCLCHTCACMKVVELVHTFTGNKVWTFNIKCGYLEGWAGVQKKCFPLSQWGFFPSLLTSVNHSLSFSITLHL